jgi:hypothetical protein
MGLFDKLFGKRKASGEWPAELFSVAKGESGGQLMLLTLNMGYKNYGYKARYPWLLLVALPPFNDVVPDQDTFETRIREILASTCLHHFIGHALIEGIWESVFYLDKPEAATEALKALIDCKEVGEFQAMCKQDPQWEHASGLFRCVV